MRELSINSLEVLKRRYLLRDDDRRIIETPDGLFRRVARHVAQAERNFASGIRAKETEEYFYQVMRDLEFMPNSPTLMNAGTPLGQLSACFVLPVEDSVGGIFNALKNMAKIHQSGGGTGFSFSHLRPRGDLVEVTKGAASGPVSFMRIFDEATGVIVQGGRRRGANMGVLSSDHPDIAEFVKAKIRGGEFSNFNLSVGVTDAFMEAARLGKKTDLINPRTGKKMGSIGAAYLLNLIAEAAHRTGDPGLIFLDEVNRKNPTPAIGRIEATNPCGELPLLPYESCNLASINLVRMMNGTSVDWDRLAGTVRLGVRFLDDVIEINRFPMREIKDMTFANRKIGLGVMGFADMLIKAGIAYDSARAVSFADRLMAFIHRQSIKASVSLAEERGVFPNYKKSVYAKKGLRLRNATVNTIAPTGTISIIAGCSSGIEPLFAVSYIRNVLSGTKLFEINPAFEDAALKRGIYTKALLEKVARAGGLRRMKGVPQEMKRIFVTAFDVEAKDHLRTQAAFQRHTDNSVSKTINLPSDATAGDIKKIYMLAYKLKLKGITVYRYGSKPGQVLSFDYRRKKAPARPAGAVTADSEYSGGCVTGTCPF